MHLRSRRIQTNDSNLRIYSGAEAERRAAGTPPGWVELQAEWIRRQATGRREGVILSVACLVVCILTAALWYLFRGAAQ